MYVSEGWNDYSLIDCSCGERLERWGKYILIRPDPQIIWQTPKSAPEWNKADAKYTRSSSGGGSWEKKSVPESWNISYKELTFRVHPTNFKHTGLFPEQAANWDYIDEKIRRAGRAISVLNLFAYTGAASIAAANAGASVCHVDAARGMVSWARENAEASGLSDKPIRWIVDDCLAFLEREIRRGRKYDAIMMDPPSYGRGASGETWKLEDDLWRLVSTAARVLSDNPLFIIISSYTTGLSPATLTYISESLISAKFGGKSETEELGLRVRNTGLFLPCGSAMRWSR